MGAVAWLACPPASRGAESHLLTVLDAPHALRRGAERRAGSHPAGAALPGQRPHRQGRRGTGLCREACGSQAEAGARGILGGEALGRAGAPGGSRPQARPGPAGGQPAHAGSRDRLRTGFGKGLGVRSVECSWWGGISGFQEGGDLHEAFPGETQVGRGWPGGACVPLRFDSRRSRVPVLSWGGAPPAGGAGTRCLQLPGPLAVPGQCTGSSLCRSVEQRAVLGRPSSWPVRRKGTGPLSQARAGSRRRTVAGLGPAAHCRGRAAHPGQGRPVQDPTLRVAMEGLLWSPCSLTLGEQRALTSVLRGLRL